MNELKTRLFSLVVFVIYQELYERCQDVGLFIELIFYIGSKTTQ